MRALIKLFLIILLVSTVLVTTPHLQAQNTTIQDAQNAAYTTYLTILNAHNAGAETTPLTEQLNQGINLIEQAQQIIDTNPQQAEALAIQAKQIFQDLTQQATSLHQAASDSLPIIPIATAAILIALGVIIYLFGPKLLWRIWFKTRGKYQIKVGNGTANKKSTFFITAEQLCAIILVLMVIIAFVSVSGILLPKNMGEKFSELAILGPNMQLGDYPSVVVASETVNLYGYVGNHMGEPIYYTVMVKIGDNNTATNPAPIQPIQEYSQVLQHNQTWTFPMEITMTNPGDSQRIIFELWTYNQTLNQNQYHQRWGQIWLNVTAPVR